MIACPSAYWDKANISGSIKNSSLLLDLRLGARPGSVVGFFTTDSLSLLFTFVIIWIARKLDGVYEDQKHYLLRLHAREE